MRILALKPKTDLNEQGFRTLKNRKGLLLLGGSRGLSNYTIAPISHIVTPIIPIINLLTKSP